MLLKLKDSEIFNIITIWRDKSSVIIPLCKNQFSIIKWNKNDINSKYKHDFKLPKFTLIKILHSNNILKLAIIHQSNFFYI